MGAEKGDSTYPKKIKKHAVKRATKNAIKMLKRPALKGLVRGVIRKATEQSKRRIEDLEQKLAEKTQSGNQRYRNIDSATSEY